MVPPETFVPFLDLRQQHKELKPLLLNAFEEALDGAAFVGGEKLESFEAAFAAYCGVGDCAGVSNGTDALRLALQALGLRPGFLALTVPNTFIATTEAISLAGGRFAFVDVAPDTSLMDMGALEEELKRRSAGPAKERPDVVIPVHLYGQCADMATLMRLAEEYGFLVLEDAAQAHGATQDSQCAGAMGHVAGFSFYAGKNLGGLGEAGAVTSNDAGIVAKVRMLREHGQREKYIHLLEGSNARLDAIQAAFLQIKLAHLDRWNASRRSLAAFYDASFAGCDWLRPVRILPENHPSRHLYVLHTARRDALADHLKARNIQTGLHYPLPLHLQECYAHLQLHRGSFPVAERLAQELISLPLYPEMTQNQIRQVVEGVLSFQELL